MNRNRGFWTLSLFFYMALLLMGSLKPVVSEEASTPLRETLHNLCHFPAYAGLTFFAIGFLVVCEIKSVFGKAFIFSVLYGILIEILQGWVPGRTPSLLDVFLNTSGALTMVFLIKRGFMNKLLSKKF